MTVALVRALSNVFIIFLGYILNKTGFFGAGGFGVVSKIVLNITLPCAILTNFSRVRTEPHLLAIALVGFLCNLIIITGIALVTRKRGREERAFSILNTAGYNIGCFTLPYVQGFLSPVSVVATCLFDAGNCFMYLGGAYPIAERVLNPGSEVRPRAIFKRIFSNVPLIFYLAAFLMAVLGLTLPPQALELASYIGGANGFLAMFMLGLGFTLEISRENVRRIAFLALYRLGISVLLAAAMFFLLPFSPELRKLLVIIAFGPSSALCSVFTQRCGGDVGMSCTANSVSVIMSIVSMTVILYALDMA